MSKKNVETPLMKQYYNIKDQHPDAILLFRVGDFYETFAEDAVRTAGILGITLTKRANGSAQFVELAGFPHHALDNYLPKLVRAGCRVAICDQLEDPKKTKTLVKRGITELVTPGIVMGDNALQHKENNYLAAVQASADGSLFGLSLLDISTGEFVCSQGSSDHVEKLLESYQPKELLLERGKRKELEQQLGYRGFVFELEDWAFSPESSRERLLSHFGVHNLKGFGLEKQMLAIASSGAILSYLELTSHTRLGHITTLRSIDRSDYMRLDAFTLRSLELILPLNMNEGKSLLDIIDRTHTPMGGRLLRQWLAFPLLDRKSIEERQQIVEAFLSHQGLMEDVSRRLKAVGDLDRLASKLAVGRIGPREMNQLASSLRLLSEIKTMCAGVDAGPLAEFSESFESCKDVCDLISRTLDPEAPFVLGRGRTISEGVSHELDELRYIAHGGKAYLQELQQRESVRTGIPSLKIGFNNVFGYYIEVRNTHKDRVPEEWIRKQTLVQAERYIIPELKEYEEKILGAEDRINSIETQLFSDLILEVCKSIPSIQRNSRQTATMDCLLSFAVIAEQYRYVCPEVNDSSIIEIQEGRHPVIENQLPLGQGYVPNDVHLDDQDTQIMVITGPNMSGKSALLRQTALITLLAQVGSFVPAKKASIGIVDAIFTRVGASDNISRGESTFMVEMQEAASILNSLTPRSLILFDELGRGTSTYDGISIAWSIIEYLHDNPYGRPKTLFATHYHELNELEKRLERVHNYSVSAQETEGKMLFLRKLVRGGSEHSFGIQVARLGGMPQSIVARASKILKQLEDAHTGTTEIEQVAESIGAKRKQAQRPPKEQAFVQMSLFELEDPLLTQLKKELNAIKINDLTPLQALNRLSELINLLK